MSVEKLISVIVPVYNIEDYVEKCIESLVGQTYSKLEIILVDDGSTDKSGELCDKYANLDARIKVFHKENGGLSDARNYAIERASGKLLAFVDGDDWVHPQMYEILLDTMNKEQADIVTCWFERNDESFAKKRIDKEGITYRILSKDEAIVDIESPLVVAWNKLYRRELFMNIRYPIGRLHEDEFIIHELFWKCKKIVVIDVPLYFYTLREGSIVAKITPKRIEDALQAFENRVEFAATHQWNAVFPAMVKRYCDYAISRYYSIKNGRDKLDGEWLEYLWNAEKDMVTKYKNVDISAEYKKFAKSPKAYEKYGKRQEKIRYYKEIIIYIYRRVFKHGEN